MSEPRGKLNVAVLMGGKSSEHEVSLNSGTEIIKSLDKNKYRVKPIKITKDGRWLIPPGFLELPEKIDLNQVESAVREIAPLDPSDALDKTHADKIDVVVLALHGKGDEDGSIQGLLEIANIPYTGSGVLASALAMDKEKSSEVFIHNRLTVPGYKVFEKGSLTDTDIEKEITKEFKLPFVIKPVDSGSSISVTIVRNINQLEKAIKDVWQESSRLMVQEFIPG